MSDEFDESESDIYKYNSFTEDGYIYQIHRPGYRFQSFKVVDSSEQTQHAQSLTTLCLSYTSTQTICISNLRCLVMGLKILSPNSNHPGTSNSNAGVCVVVQ